MRCCHGFVCRFLLGHLLLFALHRLAGILDQVLVLALALQLLDAGADVLGLLLVAQLTCASPRELMPNWLERVQQVAQRLKLFLLFCVVFAGLVGYRQPSDGHHPLLHLFAVLGVLARLCWWHPS